MRRVALLAAALALVAAGCDIRTAGAPKGSVVLSVVVPDAQHLVPGHAVRVADVQVGTVTGIELDGYAARITFSVADDRPVPEGTVASLSQTSLLGENYVRLEFPPGFDPVAGPFVATGTELAAGTTDPSLESVTADALDVLGAVEGADLSRIVGALATGTAGRGPLLNRVIVQLSELGAVFASQTDDLDATIAGVAALGADLAADDGAAVEQLATDLAAASETLARQRDRFVETLTRVTELGVALDDAVVGPHAGELDEILSQLDDVAATLADNRATVGSLLEKLAILSERAPRAADAVGGILFYGWIRGLVLPGDVPIVLPDLTALLNPPGAGG